MGMSAELPRFWPRQRKRPASAHGALWVSNRDTSAIVKLGLNGTQTSYPVSEGAFPSDIVLGWIHGEDEIDVMSKVVPGRLLGLAS